MTKVQDDNTPYKRYVVTASASVPNAATGTFNEFIDTDNTTKLKSSSGVVTTVGGSGGGSVSDLVYGVAWNGVTGTAPSQNAVYDKIESLGSGGSVSDLVYGVAWDGVTGTAPSQNAVYDKIQTLSSGALVFLQSATAADSASLTLTSVSDTYTDYLIKITGIVPATAAANLVLRFATDATPTWDGGNNYRWGLQYWNMGAASGGTGDGGATSGIRIGGGIATTAGYSFNADIRLSNLRTTALYKSINSRAELLYNADANLYGMHSMGFWLNGAVKAAGVQLIMSAGNITSGVAKLYGIVDA